MPARTRSAEVPDPAIAKAVAAALRVRDAQARVEAARREREAADAYERSFHGGPCAYCGVTRSAVLHVPDVRNGDRPGPPEERPFWVTSPAGPCCAWCDQDRRSDADPGRVLSDEEHRDRVARRLVGPDLARHHMRGYLAERVGFRWWHEAPDEVGTQPRLRRFKHLSVEKLRDAARLAQPRPPAYESGRPCPRCGCAHMWVSERGQRECRGCAWAADLADVVTRLVGLNGRVGTSLMIDRNGRPHPVHETPVSRLGIKWYEYERPRPGRMIANFREPLVPHRTGPSVTLTPFAYLDVEAIRREAIKLYPGQQWWQDGGVWLRLVEEAAHGKS